VCVCVRVERAHTVLSRDPLFELSCGCFESTASAAAGTCVEPED